MTEAYYTDGIANSSIYMEVMHVMVTSTTWKFDVSTRVYMWLKNKFKKFTNKRHYFTSLLE